MIFASEEIENLNINVSGKLNLILLDILFKEDEVLDAKEREKLYDKIMHIFKPD